MTNKPYRLLLCFVLLFAGAFNVKAQSAKPALLKNVGSIPMPPPNKYISFIFPVNEQPEIIATTKWEVGVDFRASVIAVSTLGKGKVLLLGSSVYLKPEMLQNKNVIQLITNTLNWAGAGKKRIKVALTRNVDNKGLHELLTRQQAFIYPIKDFNFNSKTDVLILNEDVKDPAQLKRIEEFIRKGGTLILGSPYPDIYEKAAKDTTKSVENVEYTKLDINKLLAKAGLFNIFRLTPQSPANKVLITDSIPDYLQVNTLLPRVLIQNKVKFDYFVDYYYANATLELVFKYNDLKSPVLNHIKQYFKVPDILPVPAPGKPVVNNTPELKAATKIGYLFYAKQQDFENHPTAKAAGYEAFPGEVPKTAARVSETVTIPVMVGTQGLPDMPSVYYRPHSTGLYIPAGEKVKITISSNNIKQHLKAQIGVHDDELTHLDELMRAPVDLTKTFELDKENTEVYSPYGGLLLINIADTSKLKSIKINVSGAVKAPYFKLGETSEQDWNNSIRNNPGPWAELATDKIVFTVPSYRIRNLSNPVKLMQFWDEVMDADADLAIISRKRVHQERIIIDVQVAYGSLYTIPSKIIGPDDENCPLMLDEAFMRSTGLWGHFHELGHRHQFFDLDFPGTTEVTVNLFTMYVYDKVLHKGIYNHEDMENKAKVIEKVKAYLANDPSYEKWSDDPFLALSMYIQIIDQFGWDAIKAANTVYRNLPKDQYPKTDQDKRDLWFTTICKATNSNLGRFFDVWKIEVSETAKKQVSAYPTWFPKELEGN